MDSQVFEKYHFSCIMFWSFRHRLQGYADVDVVGDKDSRRSTIGYVFIVGRTPISWISKLQNVVALSTTEVEYVADT